MNEIEYLKILQSLIRKQIDGMEQRSHEIDEHLTYPHQPINWNAVENYILNQISFWQTVKNILKEIRK